MNLLPLAEKLEADGVGVMADTIFINMIPVEAPTGVLLRNPLQGTLIDYELPGFYKTTFKVICRAPNYAEGEALIQAVFDSLTVIEAQVGPMYVKHMWPRTKPVVFPLSKGNLLELSADFDVCFCE